MGDKLAVSENVLPDLSVNKVRFLSGVVFGQML